MAIDKIQNVKDLNKLIQDQITSLKGVNTEEEKRRLLSEQVSNYQRVINELQKEQVDKGTDNFNKINDLRKEQRKVIDQQKLLNTELQKSNKYRQLSVDLAKNLGQQLKLGWKYLQDADKIIKSTNLNLGMSGAKAVAMRDAFEKSAGYVTRLGGTIADIQGIMQGYAEETGRARALSSQMVEDITNIGKGTGLGIEQATRLGAQFELMGFDARSTMDYVQGVVDTSERMGVNTTKVLKVVNDNFKKLNTYTFRQGVKGFAEMAMYAEKFRIDIGQALNAVDVARTLEGAIDLTAQLQVMGGEFAKTDPFEMLFLARNDPAKFTEKIADMTKGVVSFRKMADGSFEKYISPADRDRLAAVAKSMGMEASALTEIAERQAEIQKMRQQMQGMGLSAEQKKVIEGAAIFNKETGKFQVKLGDTMKNVSELTGKQAESFESQQVLLEERAKQALTFDETFKATIESLKSALLPLLKGVNKMLVPLGKVADWTSKLADKGALGIASAAGLLLTAALAWKVGTDQFGKMMMRWASGGGGRGVIGSALGVGRGDVGGIAAGQPGSMFTKTGMIRKGAPELQKAKGIKSLAAGAGFGVAMAGAGAGVGMAAVGISKLADAMSKLTPEQAESLERVVKSLSWFMIGAAGAAVGIMALGAAGTAGAVGLLAFGAAIALVGGGVYLAATGIGNMAEGFGTMFNALKDVDNLDAAASGMAKIVGVLGAATLTIPAAISLGFAISRIGKHADDLVKVGAAFQSIQAVMSGSKDDFIAVENAVNSISNMNTKGGGMLADLANLLKKPLQVEFANNGKVNLVNDITLNLDGKRFMSKSYDVNIALQKHESLRHNKGS